MTDILASSSPVSRRSASGALILVNAVGIVLFIVAIWRGSERTMDIGSIVLVALAWLLGLLIWLCTFVWALGSGRLRGPSMLRAALGWLVVPALFVLAWVLVFGGHAFQLRFALSRDALDRTVDASASGTPPGPGWVGLFPATEITVDEGGTVRIWMSDDVAFVRDPRSNGGEEEATYENIVDGWYLEYAAFSD